MSGALPGTAVLQARTLASDGQGGRSASWAAYGTVDAFLSYVGVQDGEESLAERSASIKSAMVTLPAGTTVNQSDRIVYDSATWEVTEVLYSAPREIAVRVRVELVD